MELKGIPSCVWGAPALAVLQGTWCQVAQRIWGALAGPGPSPNCGPFAPRLG